MKRMSFKTKTTIWITILVSLICILSIASIITAGTRISDSQIRQSLISAVKNNADEIEYKNGILEIESDFEFYKDEVYCDVYTADFEYIDGKIPYSVSGSSEFINDSIRTEEKDGNKYLIYDYRLDFSRFEYEIDVFSGQIIKYEANAQSSQNISPAEYEITSFENGIDTAKAVDIAISHAGMTKENTTIIAAELPGYESRQVFRIEFICTEPVNNSVWIRGIVPSDAAENAFSNIGKAFLLFIPLFIVIAAIGAYFISKKAIGPVEKISSSAHEITDGNDLSKRISVENGTSEINELAETFNAMLERLQASFENEKQFTSDASHELRTPLAVIKAECEYALSKNADETDKSEALESILEQSDKMNSLVSSLLYLARTEQGTNRYRLKATDLSALIKDICEKYKADKNTIIETDIESGLTIDADESLVCRMTENLLSNAVKYGKENGNVTVRLYKENNSIILSVKDDGIGIKESDLPKIWNRFYRADASRSESDGFGLGLALVKQIAELHGARIDVKSKFGEGSEFFIIF